MTNEAYTVAQLTYLIKSVLEKHPGMADIRVQGELSNLTRHSSGHIYFTLKDKDAQISAAMFRQHAQTNAHQSFKEGDKVMARGDVNVYPPRGAYQLVVTELQPIGQGDLFAQFLALKERLAAEGLFDEKRPLPTHPRTIGVITSPTGAVLRDICQTLRRRSPFVRVKLLPAPVQGPDAPEGLLAALRLAAEMPDLELVIIGRGGGSMEDLWAFNHEGLARAIHAFPRPIISAVGHETDFTIADFVADVRAATPTAAAELAAPHRDTLAKELAALARQCTQLISNRLMLAAQQLDELDERSALAMAHTLSQERLSFGHHETMLQQAVSTRFQQETYRLEGLEQQLGSQIQARFQDRRRSLDVIEARLEAFDLERVLAAGFSYTVREGGDAPKTGDVLTTYTAQNILKSQVTEVAERQPSASSST